VICLAVSLALKPQDAGLVWLYFLLAGGVYRRRALQALAGTAAVSLPGVLWAWRVAPNWIAEWQGNLAAFAARGGVNDPGPLSGGAHGLGMLVNLQAAFSLVKDEAGFYNPASYLVCLPLVAIWIWVVLRSAATPRKAWVSLASIAALTMLPVYHHLYDAKLLLLAVPACAMLWAEGGALRWGAAAITGAGFLLTADMTWVAMPPLMGWLHGAHPGIPVRLLAAALVVPAPAILLGVGGFYLWVYGRGSGVDGAARG
jgi:hypothetical protein